MDHVGFAGLLTISFATSNANTFAPCPGPVRSKFAVLEVGLQLSALSDKSSDRGDVFAGNHRAGLLLAGLLLALLLLVSADLLLEPVYLCSSLLCLLFGLPASLLDPLYLLCQLLGLCSMMLQLLL